MSSHPALGAGVYCRSASVGATARIRIPAAERGVGVLPVPVEPYQIGGYSAVGETVWVYALGSGPGRRRREPAAAEQDFVTGTAVSATCSSGGLLGNGN